MLIKSSIITFTLQSTSAGPYRRDRHLRGWVRKAMATGYLPLLVLRLKFRAFCASGETRRQIRHHPAVADFIEYMEHTYIGERALFPPATWCVGGQTTAATMRWRVRSLITVISVVVIFLWDLLQYVNEMLLGYCAMCPARILKESVVSSGFHHRWNVRVARRHPSIWVFIRMLKDEQRLVETLCAQAERGERPPTQRLKWRRLGERLRLIRRRYRRGQGQGRVLDQYWRAVQHCIHNFL